MLLAAWRYPPRLEMHPAAGAACGLRNTPGGLHNGAGRDMLDDLFLPQLLIRGFRGIAELSIPRLGRVTLLAGKNGVGKTTVLDAVRVYAARARRSVLYQLLRDRQEITDMIDEDGDRRSVLDWGALFTGRNPSESAPIVVGPENPDDQLEIRLDDNHGHAATGSLRVTYRNSRRSLRLMPSEHPPDNGDEPPSEPACEYLAPGTSSNERQTSRVWDQVALTNDESRVLRALNLVIEDDVAGVAMVGEGGASKRRVIVRLKNHDRPVPLRSLGDGAVRLFGIALALASSSGGFLLIDEAENGIHHTAQRALWTMILRTASANGTQVLATTHSWDCVRGFAEAVADSEPGAGVLVRLDCADAALRAVVYSQEALETAAEQGIEVR